MNHAISQEIQGLDYTMWLILRTNTIKINKRCIWRRRYANSIQYFRLQDWSLFHKRKRAIEVDELGHTDTNLSNEIERQKALEKELDCVFIRTNPDEKKFYIFKEIKDTQTH